MEWLAIWALCGVASALIAQNKGKDGCGWFLMGVLFGPFGILFALISTPNAGANSQWVNTLPFVRRYGPSVV